MNFLLNKSLKEAVPIEIIYHGKNNSFTKRTIIVKAINESYVKAFCLSKMQPRIFKINSILAISPVNSKQERGLLHA